MVRIWLGVPWVAVRSRIEARENGSAASEVVPAWRDATTRITKDVAVERGGSLNVRNRNDDSKQSWPRHSPSGSKHRHRRSSSQPGTLKYPSPVMRRGPSHAERERCPVYTAIQVIEGRWKPMICRRLGESAAL